MGWKDEYDPYWRADAGPPPKKDRKIMINIIKVLRMLLNITRRKKHARKT